MEFNKKYEESKELFENADQDKIKQFRAKKGEVEQLIKDIAAESDAGKKATLEASKKKIVDEMDALNVKDVVEKFDEVDEKMKKKEADKKKAKEELKKARL